MGTISNRLVAPSSHAGLPSCWALIRSPPVLARGPDRHDQRQIVPFVRACAHQDGFVRCDAVVISYRTTRGIRSVGLLRSAEENRQHDDNHHHDDDDERKEGGSQQRLQRRGDVTLVGEPVSASEFLHFSDQRDLIDLFREVK